MLTPKAIIIPLTLGVTITLALVAILMAPLGA